MASTETRTSRSRRSQGERSRQRILDAAREIAAERGYDGTSMAEVSRRCGLPTSSIYWHFVDKDDLMSHVIRDSFRRWNSIWDVSDDVDVLAQLPRIFEEVRQAMKESPEFLRLGLQLALRQRTDDPRARRMYLGLRRDAQERLNAIADAHFQMIDRDTRRSTVAFMLAAIDGLFVARELDPDVDIDRQIALQVRATVLLINDELAAVVHEESDDTTGLADAQLAHLADGLYAARETAIEIPPPTESHPGLTVGEAYRIQTINRKRDLASGHRLVGHKIGSMAPELQIQLGADEPEYGYLTDCMVLASGTAIPLNSFVAPRVDLKLAFRFARDLDASSLETGAVTAADVLDAADAVAVALEIVDSRVSDGSVMLPDIIADNASSAAVALGRWVPLQSVGPLADLQGELIIDKGVVGSGTGAAVLGDQVNAVACLVNTYGRHGQKIRAGEFVMSGTGRRTEQVKDGMCATARISGLGDVNLAFGNGTAPTISDDVRPVVDAAAALASILGDSIRHTDVVVVRSVGHGDAAMAERHPAERPESNHSDVEISAVNAALEALGLKDVRTSVLVNPADPPIAAGATVTCLIDSGITADTLHAASAAVNAAVADRLSGDLTVSPVGMRSTTFPVSPGASALSMCLNLATGTDTGQRE